MNKVLVIGVFGFMGSHIADLFSKIISNQFVCLGQRLLNIVEEIHNDQA
jgi:hypothetical protein